MVNETFYEEIKFHLFVVQHLYYSSYGLYLVFIYFMLDHYH